MTKLIYINNMQDGGDKNTTFIIEVSLGEDVTQRHQTSQCILDNSKFNWNGTLERSK